MIVAIVDWEKLADMELNYIAIFHTITTYLDDHREFITKKLANKNILFKVNGDEETALHLAAKEGVRSYSVISVLIDAARLLDSPSSANDIHPISILDDFVWYPNRNKDTALHLALNYLYRNEYSAEKLIRASPPPHGHDIKNDSGETPINIAVKRGYDYTVVTMCTYWGDCLPLDGPDGYTTVWHTAISKLRQATLQDAYQVMNSVRGRDDFNKYKYIISRHADIGTPYPGYQTIFETTDENYDTILSLSVRENLPHYVHLILAKDPAYSSGRVRKSNDLKSLISLASKKGYSEIFELLTRSYEARRSINHDGQTALHAAIIKRDEETVFRLVRQSADIVSKVDSERWTPLHYAAYFEFDSVLDATHVGYKAEKYRSANEAWWIPTPLHVAAKEGHTSALIKLMDLLPAYLYAAADTVSR